MEGGELPSQAHSHCHLYAKVKGPSMARNDAELEEIVTLQILAVTFLVDNTIQSVSGHVFYAMTKSRNVREE